MPLTPLQYKELPSQFPLLPFIALEWQQPSVRGLLSVWVSAGSKEWKAPYALQFRRSNRRLSPTQLLYWGQLCPAAWCQDKPRKLVSLRICRCKVGMIIILYTGSSPPYSLLSSPPVYSPRRMTADVDESRTCYSAKWWMVWSHSLKSIDLWMADTSEPETRRDCGLLQPGFCSDQVK